jgi:hypothetical protein
MPRPPQQSFTCSPSRPPSTAAAISPAICAGSGILPADSVRELSTTATLTPLTIPTGAPDVNDRAGFESGAAAVTPRGFCT